MLNIQVSIETLPPTCVPREPVSLSHRVGFARHSYDETRRRNVTDGRTRALHRVGFARHSYDETRRGNVTDGRTRLVGGAIRGQPDPPAGGGLPDARLPLRGGRRRAGVLAPPQPLRTRAASRTW